MIFPLIHSKKTSFKIVRLKTKNRKGGKNMNRSKLLIFAAILVILLCGCEKNDSTENTRSSVNESSAAASSVSAHAGRYAV